MVIETENHAASGTPNAQLLMDFDADETATPR